MLSKEMLGGGGNLAVDEFFLCTVGTAGGTGKRTCYGYRSGTSDDAGALQPTTITINGAEYTIIELMGYTSNTGGELPSTWMRFNKSVNATLYIAKENQTVYSIQFNNVINASIQNYMLFTDADLNKQIKVWISTTPPLGLSSSNCHLYREVA